MLFFNIPPIMEWTTSQVANIISLISAAGTVGALWFAVVQGSRNSKKINDLAEITKQLVEQNKLIEEQIYIQRMMMKSSVKPDISLHGVSFSNEYQRALIHIVNKGGLAVVTEARLDHTPDFGLETATFPKRLEQGNILTIQLNGKSSESFLPKCYYEITLKAHDFNHFEYLIHIHGNGHEPVVELMDGYNPGHEMY